MEYENVYLCVLQWGFSLCSIPCRAGEELLPEPRPGQAWPLVLHQSKQPLGLGLLQAEALWVAYLTLSHLMFVSDVFAWSQPYSAGPRCTIVEELWMICTCCTVKMLVILWIFWQTLRHMSGVWMHRQYSEITNTFQEVTLPILFCSWRRGMNDIKPKAFAYVFYTV